MLETLLHTLPYAIVNAASPTIPVAAVAVMAIPGRGRRAIAWFLLGCAVVVAVASVLVLTVFSNLDLSRAVKDLMPPWVDVVFGVVLVVLGLFQWRRPRPPDSGVSRAEKSHRSFAAMGPAAIVGLAAYMEAINLVTPPAYLGGVVLASQDNLSSGEVATVVLIDAAIVLLPVWGLLLVSVVAPHRTDAVLTAIQRFSRQHGHGALVLLLLSIGVWLILRAAWALTH